MLLLNSLYIQLIFIVLLLTIGIIFSFTSSLSKRVIPLYILRIFLSIGIIIHELSHLVIAVIFRHKITAIQLITHDNHTSSGFVKTSYNSKSIYQKLGTFFIALAPIYIGFFIVDLLFNSIVYNSNLVSIN